MIKQPSTLDIGPSLHGTSIHYNSDSEHICINNFPKVRSIRKQIYRQKRENLLKENQGSPLKKGTNKVQSRIRSNSAVFFRHNDMVSFQRNLRFLHRIKSSVQSDINVLIRQTIELYSQASEDFIENLNRAVEMLIEFRDSPTIQLRERVCEAIFKSVNELEQNVKAHISTKDGEAESLNSIKVFQFKDFNEELVNSLLLILGKFKFVMAYFGHFVHYYNLTREPLRKKARNSQPEIQLTMIMDTFTDLSPAKRGSTASSIRKGSLFFTPSKENRNLLIEQVADKGDLENEVFTNVKINSLKYFYAWKLQRWAEMDLMVQVTCKICSEQVPAKKLKKHSSICKEIQENNHRINDINVKISEIITEIQKNKRFANIELMIEKNSLQKIQMQIEGLIPNPKSPLRRPNRNNTSSYNPLSQSEAMYFQTLSNNIKQIQKDSDYSEKRASIEQNMKRPSLEFPTGTSENTNSSRSSFKITEAHTKRLSNLDVIDEVPFSPTKKNEEDGTPFGKDNNEEIKDFDLFDGLLRREHRSQTMRSNSSNYSRSNSFGDEPMSQTRQTSTTLTKSQPRPATLNIQPMVDKHQLKIDSKTKLKVIKQINSRVRAYTILNNYTSLVQNIDEFSNELDLLDKDMKRDLNHQIESTPDMKFQEAALRFLQIYEKKYPLLTAQHKNQKQINSLNRVNLVLNPDDSKSDRSQSVIHGNVDQIPTLGDKKISQVDENYFGGNSQKIRKKARSKSVGKHTMTLRYELFEKNLKRVIEAIRQHKKKQQSPMDYQVQIQNLPISKRSSIKNIVYGRLSTKSSELKKDPKNSIFSMAQVSGKRQPGKSRLSLEQPIPKRESINPQHFSHDNTTVSSASSKASRFKTFKKGKTFTTSNSNLDGDSEDNSNFLPNDDADDDFKPSHNELSSIETVSDSEENESVDSGEEDLIVQEALLKQEKNRIDLPEDDDMIQEEASYFSDDPSNLKRYQKKISGFSNLITIKDFDFIKPIGKGAFGRVWLVKRKNTGDLYAMKVINFAERMNRNYLDTLQKEKKIFQKLKGNWVAKALFTFVHENYLCIVMEFMVGGDFCSILEQYCALDEEVARFYIAEIIIALDSLHKLDIVHRDIKPDNILLDKFGHIKLTDFGLSDIGIQKQKKYKSFEDPALPNEGRRSSLSFIKPNLAEQYQKMNSSESVLTFTKENSFRRTSVANTKNSIHTFESQSSKEHTANEPGGQGKRIVGTPDYIPPEVLNGETYHDPCIDWWSVGVLMFEFITGIPPFNDETVDKIFDNVKNRRIPWSDLEIGYGDDKVTPEAKSFIDDLLTVDRRKRLGAHGIEQIKNHKFFKGFDWDTIMDQKPPIIPEFRDMADTSNFVRSGSQIRNSEIFSSPQKFGSKISRSEESKDTQQGRQSKLKLDAQHFEFTRYDILDEENQREADMANKMGNSPFLKKSSQNSGQKLSNQKWSVFEALDIIQTDSENNYPSHNSLDTSQQKAVSLEEK